MKLSKMNATWLLCAVTALILGVPAKAQSAPPDIIVTAQDNGKDITLHGSQRLIVRFSFPGGTGYGWSALMTPDSVLAFTKAPAPKEKKQAGQQDMPMVGGSHNQEFAFRAAHFTESSSQLFTMIFCTAQCDLKDSSAKIFKLGITTKKN
jgi:hypothetical protein